MKQTRTTSSARQQLQWLSSLRAISNPRLCHLTLVIKMSIKKEDEMPSWETRWDAPLSGPEDPSMEVAKISTETELPGHPPGVTTLREWGETVFPDGKHLRQTFRYVFENDPKYMAFMCKNTRLKTPWTKSFQGYALHRMETARRHNAELTKMQTDLLIKAKKATETGGDHHCKGPEAPGLSAEEWEVLMDIHEKQAQSSQPKRGYSSGEQMDAEVSPESKIDALSKIAILQREIEKLKKQVEK